MIKKVDMYSVICDNCKEAHETGSIIAWSDDGIAIEEAEGCGWLEKDGKHYCEDCFYVDDGDNIIIDESRKKESPNE